MPDLTPEELRDELDSDEPLTPQRLKRLRPAIREYADKTVPRGIAGVLPWWRDNKDEVLDALAEADAEATDSDADGDGYHECPDCDEAFDTPQGLASHSRVHADDEDE